jgi:hypothetical protein
MNKISQLTRIVLYQNLGFLVILIICYLDDLLKLPSLVFSEHPFAFMFRRSTLVSTSTRRILHRIQYLEKFIRLCAWCRRINFKGEWMPLEEFMRQGFDTPTTHGICLDCLAKQKVAAEKVKLNRKNAALAAASAHEHESKPSDPNKD